MNIFDFLGRKRVKGKDINITVPELCTAHAEFTARRLAWAICVDMIANAVGRCEFRTYIDGEERFDKDYYLWNVSPNTNQSSTAFIQKLIHKLYEDGEALVIETRPREDLASYVVADTFARETFPAAQAKYTGVVVDNVQYERKTFRENEVLYLCLDTEAKKALSALETSYQKFISAAARTYEKMRGKKWIVHVDQLPEGDDDFEEKFAKMIQSQVKPFLESGDAILPEFDGYTYRDVSPNAASAGDSRDIYNLLTDMFNFTANALHVPFVLANGKVEGTKDAQQRFLTECIDPLADQLQEEITRKIYGFEAWKNGSYLHIDTSAIMHFDLFGNAANIEKLIGSGAFSINDVLAGAGVARIREPWADRHYLTKNIGTVEDILTTTEGGEKQ